MGHWTAYDTSIWTVQVDDGPMDRPCYVNLDGPLDRRPFGHNFGASKITGLDRNFGPSKSMVGDCNFRPSKITIWDRNYLTIQHNGQRMCIWMASIWTSKFCKNGR